jgi:DNA (cytosine-5)-methyltransferase 1
MAGLQAGGDKNSGTRSSLMYETLRIVEKLKPKYVIWENVKNLLSKKHIHNFENYIRQMELLGYNSTYQVLNAKDYGVPQNRERVFTVSIRKDLPYNFHFPATLAPVKLKDILEPTVDEKYYLTSKQLASFQRDSDNQQAKGNGFKFAPRDPETYATCISTRAGSRKTDNFVPAGTRIRKLTPKECWRLMGFSDEDFEKAAKVNSDTQLYKQAGNSIVVDVLYNIFKELL